MLRARENRENKSEVIETQDEKPKKKVLPPKPWLKKKRKNPSKTTTDEAPAPAPASGYNLDFLDKLEDPNFNPFATKSTVVNDGEQLPSPPKPAASSGYNLDFLDKVDDPNFNPFENKAKVVNDEEEEEEGGGGRREGGEVGGKNE